MPDPKQPLHLDGLTVGEFEDFESDGYSSEDALELAKGLLEDAIPCLDRLYPTFNNAQTKAIKYAVYEMAKYIKVDHFNFEDATSPFQSETVGSYTYSKVSASVRNREDTGVPAFDRAVEMFAHFCIDVDDTYSSSTSSEQVFKHGYGEFLGSMYMDGKPLYPRGRWV